MKSITIYNTFIIGTIFFFIYKLTSLVLKETVVNESPVPLFFLNHIIINFIYLHKTLLLNIHYLLYCVIFSFFIFQLF